MSVKAIIINSAYAIRNIRAALYIECISLIMVIFVDAPQNQRKHFRLPAYANPPAVKKHLRIKLSHMKRYPFMRIVTRITNLI